MRRIGVLSMQNELLRKRVERLSPSASWRSKWRVLESPLPPVALRHQVRMSGVARRTLVADDVKLTPLRRRGTLPEASDATGRGQLIRLEEWEDIVSLHKQGLSIKAIARKTGLSRSTVRAALRRDGPPERVPQTRPPSKLEPYKDYLVSRLTDFLELSVETLFDEIRELGYPGTISMLKDFTRSYRVRRREAITGCRSETFLSCHVNAFAAFGGMPRGILYDNAKVVALEHSRTVVTFNAALLDFAGRYGFRPRLCRPYRAKTKGKVERAIRYVKDRCLTGRTFTGIEDMNTQIAHWVDERANKRTHATNR